MRLNTIKKLPSPKFFSGVTSKNAEIYIDCLDILSTINHGLSYRIPYKDAEELIAEYLYMTKAVLSEEDGHQFSDNILQRPGEILSVLGKFGWIRKEMEEGSFDEIVYVTKEGRFLHTLCKSIDNPPTVEFANIIINIYNIIHNRASWEENPYVHLLKPIYAGVKDLSESLMEMNTYIAETIKEMQVSRSYADVTENFIGFSAADFSSEFNRLSAQSIYFYRHGSGKDIGIIDGVQEIREDAGMFERIVAACAEEEKTDLLTARDQVNDMFDMILDFMDKGYENVYDNIKAKIQHYIEIMIGRFRYLRRLHSMDYGKDIRNTLEIVRIKLENGEDISDTDNIFTLCRQELLDPAQTVRERKSHVVKTQVVKRVERLSQKQKEEIIREMEKKAVSMYDLQHVDAFIRKQMRGTGIMRSWNVPLNTMEEFLYTMASAMYAYKLGYDMEIEPGYGEQNGYSIRRYTISEKEDQKSAGSKEGRRL